MRTRILTGLCLLAVAIPIMIFSDTFVFVAVMSLLAAIGVFEMFRCLGMEKNWMLSIPSYCIALLAPGATRFSNAFASSGVLLFSVFYLYTVYILACSMFSRGKIRFADAALTIVSTVYIGCGFSCFVATRDIETHGMFLLLMAFVITYATDIFAFFVGVFFGKHKLIVEVSPKKTIEGSVGGTVLGTASFVGCAFLYSHFFKAGTPNVLPLIVCGIALSIVSQIGDLIASFIKREKDIKDYGRVFPGHGGVMDRFDSAIAVMPVMYLLMSSSSAFTLFN